MSDPIPAVIYAAKSTEDTHGSIPTQLEDCGALADRERWEVVGEFSDEAFSAFSGNRGPDLDRAKTLAAATAAERGRCLLVAQDADRFARGAGDAPGAADHLGEVYFAMKRQGVELWTVRSGRLDLLRAAIEGERANDESARKTQAVRAGLKRRKDRGAPVGPLPLGYKVESTVVDGQVITSRVVDPVTSRVIERIFGSVERGFSFGAVSRMLNAEGIRTRPRKGRTSTFASRTVREIVHNEAYKGEKGYPQIIDPERFDTIQKGLKRLDPAALAKRRSGRPPKKDSYVLKGVAFCRRCGASMWTRELAAGRHYTCSNARKATGLCSAAPVPAELIERHVLDHLHVFVGSVEDWIAVQVAEGEDEQQARAAAIGRERDRLADLDRHRERHLAEYRRLVADGASVARIALEEVERIDGEHAALQRQIAEGEAVLAEWAGPPDVDAALDFYGELVDLVQGRINQARGAAELNRALGQVLAGLWMELDGDRLKAGFRLRVTDEPDTATNGLRQVLMRDLGEQPIGLPWKGVADRQSSDLDSVLVTPQLEQLLREADDPEDLLADIVAEQQRTGKVGTSRSCTTNRSSRRSRDTRSPPPSGGAPAPRAASGGRGPRRRGEAARAARPARA
jgi:DNA invertase Pin-like site-specific DNA recombinase